MATYNIAEQTAEIAVAIARISAASRDNIYTTKAVDLVTYNIDLPDNDASNTSSADLEDSETYHYDSGCYWTYTTSYVELYDIINGSTASSYWYRSSGSRLTGQQMNSTFSSLAIGASSTIAEKAVLGYIATKHSWNTSSTYHPEQGHTTPTVTNPDGSTSGGDYVVDQEAYYSFTLNTSTTEYTRTVSDTSDTQTVYTRPGTFSFGCQQGHTIQSSAAGGLSAARVGEWSVHCGKYLSWYNQANKYGNSGTYAGGATSGGLITATWYNTLAGYCGLADRVTGGHDGTIITAELINKLGTAISKGD